MQALFSLVLVGSLTCSGAEAGSLIFFQTNRSVKPSRETTTTHQASPAITQVFSASACQQFIQAQDWDGLKAFAQRQVDEHPKDACAWFYLGFAQLALKEKVGFETSLTNLARLDERLKVYLLYQPGADDLRFDGLAKRALAKDWTVSSAPTIWGYRGLSVAKEAGIEGEVLLDVLVDGDGIPLKADVVFGPKALRHFAQEEILKFRFTPIRTKISHEPVRLYVIRGFSPLNGRSSMYQALPDDLIPPQGAIKGHGGGPYTHIEPKAVQYFPK